MSFNGSEGSPINQNIAAEWTKAYREASPSGLHGHFFGREILTTLLGQEGCKGIRLYYGLHNGVQQLLAVGADQDENDQLDGDFIVADDASKAPPCSGQLNILNN